MLRRPENSLECLLATEEYSCTRYPFFDIAEDGERNAFAQKNVEKLRTLKGLTTLGKEKGTQQRIMHAKE
jgi:hypothetical protein